MELVRLPISIDEALAEVSGLAAQIRRKNTTLIDYYIYPEETPSEIAAYDPRLVILQSRISALSRLSYAKVACILDDPECVAARYLLDIVDQLIKAADGFRVIFEDHYDRELIERKPYEAIIQTLLYRENQLKDLIDTTLMNSNRVRPEDIRPNEPIFFCRGAVQLINYRDRGGISLVDKRELLEANKAVLQRMGGAYLWWECTSCAFRLRFHVSSSITCGIHNNDELREHPNVPLEYRSVFLAKSHVYNPHFEEGSRSSGSGSASFAIPPKYGCVFCFAQGSTLERGLNAFVTGKDLAVHIAGKHGRELPPSLMLHKLNAAVDGKCPEGVRRWDINFT